MRNASKYPPSTSSERLPGNITRVLVIDRNRMSSQMLADSLAKYSTFHAIAVNSTSEALAAIDRGQIDLAIVSADLGGKQSLGISFARTVHTKYPQLGLVILLERSANEEVIEAFRSGARAVFSRTEPITEMLRCVQAVSKGELWAGRVESDVLLQAFRSIPAPHISSINGNTQLTKRELQVVQYAARGFTNKVIADQLGLSEHTVKNYLFRSFEKLGVSSRVELLFFLTVKGNFYAVDNPETEPTLDNCCAQAEKGFAAAHMALSIAAEKGWEPHISQSEAYLWLRLTETASEEAASRSRGLIEQLRNALGADLIDELEPKIAEALRNLLARTQNLVQERVDRIDNDWAHPKSA